MPKFLRPGVELGRRRAAGEAVLPNVLRDCAKKPGRRLYGQRSGRVENGNERSGGERLTGQSNALRCRSRCP